MVKLISKECSSDFLVPLLQTKKFLYLTGNTFLSVPPLIKESISSWFTTHFDLPLHSEMIVSNETIIGELNRSIETVPTFSTIKKREVLIHAFPKGDFSFCWSPSVRLLNSLLIDEKWRTSCFLKQLFKEFDLNDWSQVETVLNKLSYSSTDLKQAFLSGMEIHFSTPPGDWIFFYHSEIDPTELRFGLRTFLKKM